MTAQERQPPSVALQNATQSPAEHERMQAQLLEGKQADEQKTRELALFVAGMRAALEATADALVVSDVSGAILDFNEKYVQMWDLDRERLRSQSSRDVVRDMSRLSPDPQAFIVRVEQICAEVAPQSTDVLQLVDGRVVERVSRIQTMEGREVGRVWSFRDVTRVQQAQRELRELNEMLEARVAERTAALQRSELQFRQLVAGVNDCAIYMLDPQGRVVSWNPGAERIKGYSSAEIIGRHFSTFYTDADRAAGKPEQTLSIAGREGKYEAETWRVRKGGARFWASVLVDAIRDAEGRLLGFAKITRDMTERRAIQEQLHQAQKMEAIGQLTGGVSHDFNNLLTVILGNLDTIGRHLPQNEERLRNAVNQAIRGAQRAATLTSQLLAFSRRQPLNPKPTDVNRLVAGASDLMRRTLGENITMDVVLADGLWDVEVDPHQLESALLNLTINARDAMPGGGKITFETANVHLDDREAARLAEITPGQYTLICVSDTGVGMTHEVLENAFDPFFTTKAIGEGAGLGLSQVFGFVKQSGGHVKLYSEPRQGTTVKIYLPRMSGAAPLHEPEKATSEEPHGDPAEAILVVEDDAAVRAFSTECLRELGFTVLQARDGSTALRVLEEHAEVQLLFTDVGLPGVNGRQLADEARRRKPGLKVLFTSGYARSAIVHQGRLDPGVELLSKPFTRAQLAARVREVLDSGRQAAAGRPGVLLVEDEPLIRMFLAETLQQRGLDVVQCISAREAATRAEGMNPPVAAFIDVGLPDRNGLELAGDLRSRWPDLKLVIASGYGDAAGDDLRHDRRAAFLKKPFDEAAVTKVLQELGIGEGG